MTKICVRCKIEKDINEFYKRKSRKDGFNPYCKECHKIYYEKNKERISEKHKIYYGKNKENILKNKKIYRLNNNKEIRKKAINKRKLNPWYNICNHINQRCNNKNNKKYKHYGAKGIKNKITLKQVKFLFIRDGGFNMVTPSIHRLNNNRDYSLSNCKFIEASEHATYHNKLRKKIA